MNLEKENGITLVALIITIIVLIILTVVSIKAVIGDNLVDVSAEGVANYAKEQKKEEEAFNEVDNYIKVATNKKPNIETLKYSERTLNTMKITAVATDEDGDSLTYKLFLGTSIENLVEQSEIKENIEEGTEVAWTVPVIDNITLYYYKIIVSDKYSNVDSGIIETRKNHLPIIKTNISKDISINQDDPTQSTSWIQIATKIEDEDNDNLTIKMYLGTDESEKLNETDLIYAQSEINSRRNINTKKR